MNRKEKSKSQAPVSDNGSRKGSSHRAQAQFIQMGEPRVQVNGKLVWKELADRVQVFDMCTLTKINEPLGAEMK